MKIPEELIPIGLVVVIAAMLIGHNLRVSSRTPSRPVTAPAGQPRLTELGNLALAAGFLSVLAAAATLERVPLLLLIGLAMLLASIHAACVRGRLPASFALGMLFGGVLAAGLFLALS